VYSWKEYWDKVASAYGGADAQGFAPVLHPDAPSWYNLTIDRLQEKSWRRGLQSCGISDGAQVLDVGCGTGRWLRRYKQMQVRAVGLDATQDMLRRALSGGSGLSVVAARAQRLPFPDAAFDLVSDVTVVQHIASLEQDGVLKEMARVLKPGGYLLLIELIKGEAPHIFPRAPQKWIEAAAAAGLSPVKWEGQEFLVLDQLFVRAAQTARRLTDGKQGAVLPAQGNLSGERDNQRSASRSIYWALRRVSCKLSEWAEPLVRKTCPGTWATHAVFVFQKRGGGSVKESLSP
jgi:SAM-dependent methyltransferase